jgi:hypothetical protein
MYAMQVKQMLDGRLRRIKEKEKMGAIALMKFSDSKYLDSLITKGLLYFNTIQYFKQQEDNHVFDEYEGFDVIIPPKNISVITINGRDFKPAPSSKPVKLFLNNQPEITHICCFYIVKREGVLIDNIHKVFHDQMFEFGDSLCVITEVDRFQERVINAIKRESKLINGYMLRAVEYYDENEYTTNISPFKKRKKYEYQSEYRIAINSDCCTPFVLSIGNLSDIVFGPINKEQCVNIIKDGDAII